MRERKVQEKYVKITNLVGKVGDGFGIYGIFKNRLANFHGIKLNCWEIGCCISNL